jgi:hypothetical protein
MSGLRKRKTGSQPLSKDGTRMSYPGGLARHRPRDFPAAELAMRRLKRATPRASAEQRAHRAEPRY